MSGLLSALAVNVKSLAAQSAAVETAGRNLANVNNPNYARQRVQLGTRAYAESPQGSVSLGVEALQIEQLRDSLLDRQLTRELSVTSSLTSQQSAYQRAQAALGQSIDRTKDASTIEGISLNQGLGSSISDFFASFDSFAAAPTDSGQRQVLLQKADTLADHVRLVDSHLANVQTDLTDQATVDLTKVNAILTSLSELNFKIHNDEINTPGSATTLRDERQAKLETLAGLISFQTQPSAGLTGGLDIFTYDSAGTTKVPLVSGSTTTGPVTLSGSTLSGGASSSALSITGGSLQGSLLARDTVLAGMRTSLNALASQLTTAVNAAYNPTGATGNFFLSSGTTAASFTLDPNVTALNLKASDGGPAADNTLARAVADLINKSFSTTGTPAAAFDGTFSQHYTHIVTTLGEAASGANTRLTDQTNIEAIIRTQRDAVSAVSVDEESADLIKFQRSYQASARVITVIDEMLTTLLNMGR